MTTVQAPPGTSRLLAGLERAGTSLDLAAHLAIHGPLPLSGRGDRSAGDRLVALVVASGLTGRGGAAFPTGAKLAAFAGRRRRPVLVVNAMEGEPASHKDEVLVTAAPHLVLDGAAVMARAIGADTVRLTVARDRPRSARLLERAIAERRAAGLIGPADLAVDRAPAHFITGEESALVHWLDGGESRPTFRPERPGELRVGGHPTLVENAESAAHVALIARHGPDWFRSVGPFDAPGTALLTVSGAVSVPGVYEVALGTTARHVLGAAGAAPELSAVLVGGYGGAWLPAARLDTPLSPPALAALGCTLGSGVLVALDVGGCGLAETARVAGWMAGESAGQCGPCVFGLPAVAEDLRTLAFGRASAAVADRLWQRLATVDGRGACRHPDGVVRLVRSAVVAFATDLDHHLDHGPCPGAGRRSVMTLPERGEEAWR